MIWNDRMRLLREDSDMTLQEVADKLGVTVSTAQRYEKKDGIKAIPYEIIVKYAQIFNVSPSYIMGWTNDKSPTSNSATNYSAALEKLINDIEKLPANRQEQFINMLRDILARNEEMFKQEKMLA